MKKLYFVLLSFFAGLSLNAQILTQSNNAPVIGEMFRTTDCSTTGVTPGASGASVTWDMSAVSIGTTITDYSVVAIPSSSAGAYPSASLAIQTGTTSNYTFYAPSAANLQFWGGSITVSTVNIVMTYTGTTGQIVTPYSMSFGTSTSNPVSGTLSAYTQSGTFSGTCSVTADGFGTLALPSRTFTSVLRKKTSQDLTYSASIINGTIKQENYEYFASSLSKSPLFTISTSTITSNLAPASSQTLVTINSDYQYVGINESLKEVVELNVFPNPAKHNFNLSYVNENAGPVSVEISNTLGQNIKKLNLENTKGAVKQTVDISNLESGIYFIKVNVGDKTSVRKLTIQ